MTVPVILDFVLNNIRRCDTYTDCDCNHCLSNAMHGQNINLPVCMCVCVCVCVCVSVTLSVNSTTCRTPQRIFTIDSLTDADLRKDVPFGVSMR